MKKDSVLLKIWRIIYPLLIYLFVNYIVSVVAMILIGIKVMESAGVQMTDPYAITDALVNEIYTYTIFITLVSGIIAMPILYLFYRGDRKRRESLEIFSKPSIFSYIVLGVLAVLTCVGVNNLITLSNLGKIFPGYEEIAQALYGGNIIIEVLAIVIVAPIVEEVLFRGLIYKRLRKDMKPVYAIAVSAFLFGVYHMNVVQGVYAFVIGLILGYSIEKYKTMFAPILFHMVANGIAVLMTETSIFDFLYGNNIIIIVSTAIEIILMILLILWIHKKINLEKNKVIRNAPKVEEVVS